MRRPLLLFAPALLIATLFIASPSGASHQPEFTDGVASGDVSPFSAVLWTRVDQDADLRAEVATNPSFTGPTRKFNAKASADDDFIAKVLAAPLAPDTTHFYRFRTGSSVSEVGTFKTAPLPFNSADVTFAYSGDSDGTKVGGLPFFNNFEVLEEIRQEDTDFWVYLGDTIYSDSGLRPAPAITLDEYRDAYKVNRDYQNLRDLMRDVSTYAIWDDHEVRNDYDGQTVDPTRYGNGREAFLEYMPIIDVQLSDPDCAGDPLFRYFRWGKDVDVIILDERSCRSADVEPACSFAPGVPDLAPTLPSALRPAFGLPPSPPPGCLDAIFDPDRTMIGDVQKAALKTILKHSGAKFKFVINELAIQQFYALPYDRWEGYGAERNEILNFIRDNEIDNVLFLTTDNHANLINEVFIDNFADSEPIADEFITGPIATNTLERSILALFGPEGLAAFNQILTIVGVDCRDLDAYSYGLVEVDADAGTATVTLKDDTGAILTNTVAPAVPCSRTIGP